MGLLVNRVAVVTGAGRGIGRAIALQLAAKGAKVVVNDLGGSVQGEGRDPGVATAVTEEIRAAGGEAVANFDSVASFQGGQSIVHTALDSFGRLDILVNNAGILRDHFIWRMSEKDWDEVVRVHLYGSFYCTRAALPGMQQQGWGRILFVTSTAGLIGSVAQSNYGAAKMGIVGLSRNLALEVQRYRITSNCIAPFAWTRIPASIPQATEDLAESVSRLFGGMKPETIGPLAAFLASESAAGVTGQIFGVRGKEIYLFDQPRIVRSLHRADGWTPAELARVLEPAFRPHLTPLDDSISYFTWKALL